MIGKDKTSGIVALLPAARGAGVVQQGLQQQGVACARISTGRGHLNQQAAGTQLKHGLMKADVASSCFRFTS